MLHLPLMSSPLGWLILGLGGYALYQAGKKNGEEQSARQDRTAQIASCTQTTDTDTEA